MNDKLDKILFQIKAEEEKLTKLKEKKKELEKRKRQEALKKQEETKLFLGKWMDEKLKEHYGDLYDAEHMDEEDILILLHELIPAEEA